MVVGAVRLPDTAFFSFPKIVCKLRLKKRVIMANFMQTSMLIYVRSIYL